MRSRCCERHNVDHGDSIMRAFSTSSSSQATHQLDEIDRGIVEMLRADGRTNNSVIAARLCIAEGTVRQRMRKLTEAGVVRISALVNPEIISEHQLCMVGLKLSESKRLESSALEISALPEVRSV